jgi:hypothetical protein
MKKVIRILNELVEKKIITDYAIGGAVGVIFYTEPFNTKDLDVFVIPQTAESGLVHLEPIYEYLKKLGYQMKEQWFIIEGVAVDFIPIYNQLTEEAFRNIVEQNYEDTKVRVLRPEYLLAIALKTGRAKDRRMAELLLSQANLDRRLLGLVLTKYDLKLEEEHI